MLAITLDLGGEPVAATVDLVGDVLAATVDFEEYVPFAAAVSGSPIGLLLALTHA